MTDAAASNAVNQHYLNKVIDLSENMRVEVSEDIFDARGNKLLAKGGQVSRSLQEKLIVHKLKKPLEACIFVEGGVDSHSVQQAAERVLSSSPTLAHILGVSQGSVLAPVSLLSQLKFGSALSMMLTIADREGGSALDHAVTVSLLSIAVASKARMSQSDQAVAGLAGLLHDIGELYIDPSFLAKGKRLLPHEWAHIVVHPYTGMMLINQLESYTPAVGRAVAEHHERADGSGYPRRLTGDAISAPGYAVSIAETLAGLIVKDHPLERAALALKIVPGEFPRNLVAGLSEALRHDSKSAHANDERTHSIGAEDVTRLISRIATALKMTAETLIALGSKSPRASQILAATATRIQQVNRAAISTGLAMPLGIDQDDLNSEDLALLFERDVATREIQWRLRDIARDLAMQATLSEDRLLLMPLINLLDDDYSLSSPPMVQAPFGAIELPTQAFLAAA
ncbi:HD domain-containing protein [Massilia sp. P8910]|uniref:HD-GYP domain-containing protein n=1 Tax=Massilia antarctica TaxID=2765360 RepID=UPI001E4E00CE|nr:HD domain-containing protein [Massilia antarctica]